MTQTTKTELRRSLLQQRENLSQELWREKSDRLCANLAKLPLYQQAETILAYFSIRQEPDLSPLFNNTQKIWGFPIIEEKQLIWRTWQPGEPLIQGKYNILTPTIDAPMLTASAVDLILVPGVASDRSGYRLGYGGGYYDRMLGSPAWANHPTIGIIFDFAYLEKIPIEPWDRPLKLVITD